MTSDELAPGGWEILESSTGWEFRARLNVPLSTVMPRYLRRNRLFMIAMPVTGPLIFGITAVTTSMPLSVVALLTPLVLLASIGTTVITWPLRLARGHAFHMREDGTIDERYYDLRYSELKQTVIVRARQGKLEVAGSVFSPQHLASLEVTQLDDTFPGLVGLAFSGDVVHDQLLIPWPGVDEATADEIRGALLARIGMRTDGTLTSISTLTR